MARKAREVAAAAPRINGQSWLGSELERIRQKCEQLQAQSSEAAEAIAPRKRVLDLPERPVGRDEQGRTVKEVWVGGLKHLVVD